MTNYNLAIIGNGILGLSTAFSLISYDKNIKIAIIGKDLRTGAASSAAGAMLNYIGEVTSETLKNPYSTKKLEISIEASKLWPEFIDRINSFLLKTQHIKQNPGTFVILNSKSGSLDTDNYQAIMETADKYKEVYQEVSPRDVVGLNPLDDCRPLRSLFLPNEGSIDSGKLLDALTQILEASEQVKFINNNVVKISTSDTSVKSLSLDNQLEIQADQYILTAGSYSQTLIDQIPQLSSKIPKLLAGTGISAVISQSSNNIEHVIRTPNRSGACGLHALPRSNGLYIGATNNISFTPSTKYKLGLSQFLLQCAVDQIDQDLYKSEILSWHVGNRPVTIDGFPLVGETLINNLYILTGTYRDGLQQSPLWGDYMARKILNKNSTIDHPFTPQRKLLKSVANKETAINDVVKHYMAGFYEHGMRLARLFPEKSFEQLLYSKFEKIYEALDTDFPLVPDILFLFELSEDNESNISYFKQYFKDIS